MLATTAAVLAQKSREARAKLANRGVNAADHLRHLRRQPALHILAGSRMLDRR